MITNLRMQLFEALLITANLIKSHNVDAAAEVDVLGVKAVDATPLEPLLREGVVGGEGGGQHRVHHEGEDVQAVQQTLRSRALDNSMYYGYSFNSLNTKLQSLLFAYETLQQVVST